MVEQLELVQKLVEKGCKVYGSSKCGFCKKQIALFTDEKAKKLFLEKVYKNVQDMKDKPKINVFPTLVYAGNKYPGLKNFRKLEFILNNKINIPKPNSNLKQDYSNKKYDLWLTSDNIEIVFGENNSNTQITFSNKIVTTKYQVYNESNKELNKDQLIVKINVADLNNLLKQKLSKTKTIYCNIEYEMFGDEHPRRPSFELKKSSYKNGELTFEGVMHGIKDNFTIIGKNVVCHLDVDSMN